MFFFFFQAEDGIRDRSPSRGLGDVYKRQTLPLTVAGLLSQKPAKDIQKGIDDLLQKAWKLGISKDIDPFITLSFMALPVIPSLRLTDLGLVDVDTFKLL